MGNVSASVHPGRREADSVAVTGVHVYEVC